MQWRKKWLLHQYVCLHFLSLTSFNQYGFAQCLHHFFCYWESKVLSIKFMCTWRLVTFLQLTFPFQPLPLQIFCSSFFFVHCSFILQSNHLHITLHCIPKSSFWSSPFAVIWWVHHPFFNLVFLRTCRSFFQPCAITFYSVLMYRSSYAFTFYSSYLFTSPILVTPLMFNCY